jgi:hypothetical protein
MKTMVTTLVHHMVNLLVEVVVVHALGVVLRCQDQLLQGMVDSGSHHKLVHRGVRHGLDLVEVVVLEDQVLSGPLVAHDASVTLCQVLAVVRLVSDKVGRVMCGITHKAGSGGFDGSDCSET